MRTNIIDGIFLERYIDEDYGTSTQTKISFLSEVFAKVNDLREKGFVLRDLRWGEEYKDALIVYESKTDRRSNLK